MKERERSIEIDMDKHYERNILLAIKVGIAE